MTSKTFLLFALGKLAIMLTGHQVAGATIDCGRPSDAPSSIGDCMALLKEEVPNPNPVGAKYGQCYTWTFGNCVFSMTPQQGYEVLATFKYLYDSSQAIMDQCVAPNGIGAGVQLSDGESPIVVVSNQLCPEVVNQLNPVQPIQTLRG